MAVRPTVLVLARPQGELTLRDGNFIWDGNPAMVLTAGAYEDVTGGSVAFFDRYGLTGHTAAAAAGSGRAGVIRVDGYSTGHFTIRGHDWFGGNFGFVIGRQKF